MVSLKSNSKAVPGNFQLQVFQSKCSTSSSSSSRRFSGFNFIVTNVFFYFFERDFLLLDFDDFDDFDLAAAGAAAGVGADAEAGGTTTGVEGGVGRAMDADLDESAGAGAGALASDSPLEYVSAK